jgi:DNA-binding GntR family transcriptional regulator
LVTPSKKFSKTVGLPALNSTRGLVASRAPLAKIARAKPEKQIREESSVQRLYLECRERAMRYEFRPGERVNEQALGREFGVSRSPLREALNRLVAEGFFDFVLNKGFYRKSISVEEVYNLYQVRSALECRAMLLAVEVATDAEIADLREYWSMVMDNAKRMSSADMVLADEEFHRRLVALAHNRELNDFMEQVTRRTHIARHIDVERSDWNARAFDSHFELVKLLENRQPAPVIAALQEHIDMSMKRAVEITKEMVARLFLSNDAHPVFERPNDDGVIASATQRGRGDALDAGPGTNRT